MAEETKEYLDYEGLSEYHKKSEELFQDLTIEEVEEAFNELDESDPSYSAFYDVIAKAKEANSRTDEVIAQAETATTNANEATSKADEATDRANKAAEKLEIVNDMTTGINLIRGSRDFRIGSKFGKSNFYYIDGFRNSNGYTFFKDEEGFTVAHIEASGLSSDGWKGIQSAEIYDLEVNEDITISFEFMVDDIDAFDNKYILTLSRYNGSNRNEVLEVSSLTSEPLESKKWLKAVYRCKVTSYFIEGGYAFITLVLGKNGSINFRKLTIQKGSINNPIWAPSPFDTDYINDETTGINLLRGTRDFITGTKLSTESNSTDRYTDGFWGLPAVTLYKDNEGFTCVKIARSGLTSNGWVVVDSSVMEQIEVGDTITVSFELSVDDMTVFLTESSSVLNINGELVDIPTLVGHSINELESGKWYKVVYHYTYTKISGRKTVRMQLPRNGSINFRKLCAYQGHVNNPIWSASPFDVAQANDTLPKCGLLPAGKDWGTLTTDGLWYINRDTQANQKGYPEGSYNWGILEVIRTLAEERPNDSLDYVLQRFTETNNPGAVYVRAGTVSLISSRNWAKLTPTTVKPVS